MTLEDIIQANPSASEWTLLDVEELNAATFMNDGTLCAVAWNDKRFTSAPWPWTDARIERARNVLGAHKEAA